MRYEKKALKQAQIPEILQRIKKELGKISRKRPVKLAVELKDYKVEDGWLCVDVLPVNGFVFDYAEELKKVEDSLRADGIENVLLLPSLSQWLGEPIQYV